MPDNKVQFNLKNVHYAVETESTLEGVTTYTYATPVAVPGAVTLSLSAQGDTNKFYADGISYYTSVANQGYSGDLEMAKYPSAMLKDVWGLTEGETSKVLSENAFVEAKRFALLFQIDGDAGNDYYVMYHCTGTRPGVGSTTNTESKTPQTQTSTITADPRSDGLVMARTTGDTTSQVKQAWFTKVYVEGESE